MSLGVGLVKNSTHLLMMNVEGLCKIMELQSPIYYGLGKDLDSMAIRTVNYCLGLFMN